MAKKMADLLRPRTTALSPEEALREHQQRAQIIEASQGGRYAGSKWTPQFEDPPLRPVRKGR